MNTKNIDMVQWLFQNPRRILGAMYHVGMEMNKQYYKIRRHSGDNVMEEDWDNLVILDGCRLDLFKDRNPLNGELEFRISHGSNSAPFLNKNFRGEQFHDTIYITANPHMTGNLPEGTFYKAKNMLINNWNKELETVPPSSMCMATKTLFEKYPNKRLISHWMQPHYPFIGPSGQNLQTKGIPKYNKDGTRAEKSDPRTVWRQLKFGEVSREEVRKAYQENFDLAIKYVENLISDLPGKTVITADHGNLIGDWIGPIPTRGYGHPQNIHAEELIKVPWFSVQNEERREIVAEEPIGREKANKEMIADRLESLGYV